MYLLDLYRKLKQHREEQSYIAACRHIASGPEGKPSMAWWNDPRTHFWAHAGGGRLHVYGNSQEAYDDAIASGFGVIEADVMMTADGVPVMSHRFRPNNEVVFDRTPTAAEFLACRLNGKYTPMTLDAFVKRYESADVYISIDPSPSIQAENGGKALVDYLEKLAPKSFLQKTIYQIIGLDQLGLFSRHNPFGALHYGLDREVELASQWWRLKYLIPALKRVGVGSVSITDLPIVDEICMRQNIADLLKADIHVTVPGVNSLTRQERWLRIGAEFINTDYIYPNNLK